MLSLTYRHISTPPVTAMLGQIHGLPFLETRSYSHERVRPAVFTQFAGTLKEGKAKGFMPGIAATNGKE